MNAKLFWIFISLLPFGFVIGQEEELNYNLNNSNEPDILIQVNWQMDENGNLIQFDSLYSYSYSTSNPDSIYLMDSLWAKIPSPLWGTSPFPLPNLSLNSSRSNLDSLSNPNSFFKQELDIFKHNYFDFNRLRFHFDSLRNEFFEIGKDESQGTWF
jgi:hypothetical protein